jgi:flagellar hook-associated protein FlgK
MCSKQDFNDMSWLTRFLFPEAAKLTEQMEQIMAAIDEIKEVAAEESAQVNARINELLERLTTLEGQVLTAEQIEEIKTDIRNIYVPVE